MKRHTLYASIGALALTATAPAAAQLLSGQGNVAGSVGSTVQGTVGAKGSVNANANAATRANANSAVQSTVDAAADAKAKARAKAKGKVQSTTDSAADAAAKARAKAQGAANASVQGLANSSTNSSLNVAGRTDLGAVVKGTTIKGSGGANVGTVSEVVVNRSGAVVGVKVDLDGGGTATIPASTLSVDGSAVTTSWAHKH